MHKARDLKKLEAKGGGVAGKVGVQGIVERGGHSRARVIENSQYQNVVPAVRENVEAGSHVYTDQLRSYFGPQAEYARGVINHAEMYVNGQIRTNGLENFWSRLKHGLGGTYISVELFHLFRYVDEQTFRYNHRKDANDGERFIAAMKQIVGGRFDLQGTDREGGGKGSFLRRRPST
jgi:transposase-like protein